MKRKKISNKPEILLSLIVIFGLILRLYFFVGMSMNDDIFYAYFANRIATGTYKPDSFYSVRTGILVPLAIFYYFFGINEVSSSSYFILISIGEIVLTYYLGKFLFSWKVGLLGAFLVSIFAMDIIYATQLGPDISLCFFTSLSFFLFLKGGKERK